LALGVGMLVGDFITGLLHWAFDTWFDEKVPYLGRTVIMVREHHIHPDHIFQYRFYHDAGILSLISFVVTGPVFLYSFLNPGAPTSSAICDYAVVACVVISLELVFMLEFHKCGHTKHPSKLIRTFQRLHLLLPYKHHMKHHSGNYDRNYCLINGYADKTFGALGGWRILEWGISKITGAVPRENDLRWLRSE
jgi:ubiquitin-conjugating enzyme E2 variant